MDVLEDMKEKVEEQLVSLRKTEMNAKHNFAMLKQSLEDQFKFDDTGARRRKDGRKKKLQRMQERVLAEG